MFDYESPITQILGEMQTKFDGEVMSIVQNYGIHVDKEELVRALAYDRGQYEKGYEDGLNADKWIPCSERLPDTSNWDASTIGKLFLVSYEPDPVSKLWVGIRYFNKGTNTFGGDEKVIAWQPLPLAYQMGE